MATEQPERVQTNPEDEARLSDYGDDEEQETKPDEEPPYTSINVEKIVTHWEQESHDLHGARN